MRKCVFICLAFAWTVCAFGAGTQFSTTPLLVSPAGTAVQAAIGDVDHDGRNELVIISPSAPSPRGPMRIYDIARNGAATLKYTVDLMTPPDGVWSYAQPRIVDVDGDGKPEIALYLRSDGRGGILQIVKWDATNSRFTTSAYNMPETDAAYGFAMADINGDGFADAITANHGMNAPQTIFVSYGGPFAFSTFSSYPVPFQGVTGVFGPSSRGIVFLYAQDLDRDGRPDIAVTTAPFNTIAARVLFNTASGIVAQDVAGSASVDIAVGDKNNDGIPDFALTSYGSGGLQFLLGTAFHISSRLSTPPGGRSLITGDFNGDGLRDYAVVQTLNNNISLILGGFGTFALNSPDLAAADFMPDSFVQSLSSGDVDNDGKVDLLFATDRVILIRNQGDTTPPSLTLPSNLILEATSPNGAVATFTASAFDNVDGPIVPQCAPASGSLFGFGTTTVQCTAHDAAGNVASGSFTVTVRDATPPKIVSIAATPNVIRPPNHKFVAVTVSVVATDAGDAAPQSRIIGVVSNQPANTTGDGNTQVDSVITGLLTVSLRAERSATLGDRVYTIVIEVRDRFGNASTGTTTVAVRE